MNKVWFITGSSRGLGKSLVEAVLKNGDQVVATARKKEALEYLVADYPNQVLPLALDVTDSHQVATAVKSAIEHFGRIDVLVNNAGFGVTGAAEAFTEEQVNEQLKVNLWAPIAITRAVLPYMRKQRSGRILQISSIGGRVGNPGLSIYQAAKFGLAGFTESLHKEIAPLGIYVTSIEPGGFRTDWAGTSMTFAPDIADYESTIGTLKNMFTSEAFVPVGDPKKAAQVMVDLIAHPEPPLHLVLGSEAVAILQKATENRMEELQQWLPVSLATDHDQSADFHQTASGKNYFKQKGIEL